MSSMYKFSNKTVAPSPELRPEFRSAVDRMIQPGQAQYKLLEERVGIQQTEIARLRREINRLKNLVDVMEQRINFGR